MIIKNLSKKIVLLFSIFILFNCNSVKKECLIIVKGIEKDTPFFILKENQEDTLLSGITSGKIYLDLSTRKESQFPGLYNIEFINKIIIPVIIDLRDSITIIINEKGKYSFSNVNIKSNFTKKMENFINKSPEIFNLNNIIKSKEREIEDLQNQLVENLYYRGKKKDNKIGFVYEKACKELGNYNDSIVSLIQSKILQKKDKNLEDIFVYTSYIYSNCSGAYLKSLKNVKQSIKILKEYGKIYNVDYIFDVLLRLGDKKFELENPDIIKTGDDFIDIEDIDIDRKTIIKLSDIVKNHKVVLLKFWASWCSPCIEGFASTIDLHNKYNKEGFQVFAVSLDKVEDELKWKKIIKKYKIENWIHVFGRTNWDGEIVKKYGIRGIPSEFLIVNAKIRSAGYISNRQKEKIIKKYLNK